MRRSGLTPTILAAIAALLGCSDSELPTEAQPSPGSALRGVAEFEAPTGAFYGPERFVRTGGRPVLEERSVDLDGYGAPYALHVRNGDAGGGNRVSSGEVYADGERILGPSDFSPRVSGFVIPVEASGYLGLAVELRGGPGSELTVWVEGMPLPHSVAVTPETASFASLGATRSFSAAVFGPRGEPLADPVTWSSSDVSVATVDDGGVVTAVGNGEASITAAAGDAAGSAAVTVAVPTGDPDPTTSTVEVSTGELPADGESTATATVSLRDSDGVAMGTGGHEVSFEITPINENTPGATIAEVIDNGDGTYSATIVPPVNNGTGTLIATMPSSAGSAAPSLMASSTAAVDTVGTVELTYSGGNEIPELDGVTFATPEDVPVEITLPGSDPDGDALTWRIESRYLSNGQHEGGHFRDADGTTVIETGVAGWHPADLTLADNTLHFHPEPDAWDLCRISTFQGVDRRVCAAMLVLSASDGIGSSGSDTVFVEVTKVNDAPRTTLPGKLYQYEGTPLEFSIGGFDPESDRYGVLITLAPQLGRLAHHHFTGDVFITGGTNLKSLNDQSNGWPMTHVAIDDDEHGYGPFDWYYDTFMYLLEEEHTRLRSDEARVDLYVLPVNDAPTIDIAGIGEAQNHDLAATVEQGTGYVFPAIAIDDAELVPTFSPWEGSFDVTIEVNSGGILQLDTQDYEDAGVVFETTYDGVAPTIRFTMPYDVSAQGAVAGLTLDRLLSSLSYRPRSTGMQTLTITIGDGGVGGSCQPGPMINGWSTFGGTPGADPAQAPPPCVHTSVTTILMDAVPDQGSPDGTVIPLTPAGAGGA